MNGEFIIYLYLWMIEVNILIEKILEIVLYSYQNLSIPNDGGIKIFENIPFDNKNYSIEFEFWVILVSFIEIILEWFENWIIQIPFYRTHENYLGSILRSIYLDINAANTEYNSLHYNGYVDVMLKVGMRFELCFNQISWNIYQTMAKKFSFTIYLPHLSEQNFKLHFRFLLKHLTVFAHSFKNKKKFISNEVFYIMQNAICCILCNFQCMHNCFY